MIGYAYWSTLLWHERCCQVSNLHFDCKDLFLQFPDHSPATVSTRGTILLASTMELTVLSRCCCFLDSYPLNPRLSSPDLVQVQCKNTFLSLQGEVKPIGWSDVNGWVAEVAVNFEMCHK